MSELNLLARKRAISGAERSVLKFRREVNLATVFRIFVTERALHFQIFRAAHHRNLPFFSMTSPQAFQKMICLFFSLLYINPFLLSSLFVPHSVSIFQFSRTRGWLVIAGPKLRLLLRMCTKRLLTLVLAGTSRMQG